MMDDLGVIIQAGWMIFMATWMMAVDDENKKKSISMIFRLLGEVHSCHPSIIPVSTLVFLGRVWPWQPKLSSSSHHHPRLKGPSARKTSSRHHPKVQKMIIQPSSKTQGALSKKKKNASVVIIFVRLPCPSQVGWWGNQPNHPPPKWMMDFHHPCDFGRVDDFWKPSTSLQRSLVLLSLERMFF